MRIHIDGQDFGVADVVDFDTGDGAVVDHQGDKVVVTLPAGGGGGGGVTSVNGKTGASVTLTAADVGADPAGAATSAAAAVTADSLGVGTGDMVEHAELGVGTTVANANVVEVLDTTTETSTTAHHATRINDNRTLNAELGGKGVGGKTSGLFIDTPLTVDAGHTADYAGVTVNALAFDGAGSFGVVSAYEMHFDLQNTGDPTATQQNGLATHLGILNGGAGIIQDQQSVYVGAMNALGPATTLSANVAVGDTTLHLTDGSQFTGKGPYLLIVDHPVGRAEMVVGEIVKVTSGLGTNTVTVTRAQGGTAAASHISGLNVFGLGLARATGFVQDETGSYSAALTYGFRIGNFWSQHMGPLAIGGSTTYDRAAARLDVRERNANQDVLRLASAATSGADIVRTTAMNKITTTSTSAAQIFGLQMANFIANSIITLDITITWRDTTVTATGGSMRNVMTLFYNGSAISLVGTVGSIYNQGTSAPAAVSLGGSAFGIQQIMLTPPNAHNTVWSAIVELTSVNA